MSQHDGEPRLPRKTDGAQELIRKVLTGINKEGTSIF
jgi:hypothetical protein